MSATTKSAAPEVSTAKAEVAMKRMVVTLRCAIPVPATSILGGSNSNKGLSKLDRENRYFLNALVRRGAEIVSTEDAKA